MFLVLEIMALEGVAGIFPNLTRIHVIGIERVTKQSKDFKCE